MVLKNPPRQLPVQPVRPVIKQVAKPQASPKQHLAGLTKTQLCRLIFKHEAMERQRIDTINKQQGLISRQSGALIWQAEKTMEIAKQFPAIKEKEEFKQLLIMSADLVKQAEQFKAFAEKEAKDGTSHGKPGQKLPEETTGKGGGKTLPHAGIQKGTDSLRDPDQEREAGSLHAQPGDQGQDDGRPGREPDGDPGSGGEHPGGGTPG